MNVNHLIPDMSDRKSIREFINNTESNIFTGTNADREEIEVRVQKGEGMEVRTRHHNKPNWWEVVYYDADGYQEGLSYEPTAEYEERMQKIREERR